jgi:hypothetical protein
MRIELEQCNQKQMGGVLGISEDGAGKEEGVEEVLVEIVTIR